MSLARRRNRYSYLVNILHFICDRNIILFSSTDQSLWRLLSCLCANLRFSDNYNHSYSHEPIANTPRVCLHPKNQDMYLLFSFIGGSRRCWRR